LAGALFLLLRHYPEASVANHIERKNKLWKLFSHLPKLPHLPKMAKKSLETSIKAAIDAGNEHLVLPEVEKIVKTYTDSNPEISTFLEKAEEAYNTNDLREAENQAIEAISKDKRCAVAYIIIGKVAYSRGQFEEAKEAFKMAIKCNREAGEAYFGLGQVEFRRENLSDAIENLQKAIVLEKGNAEWYGELGRAYMEVRQYAKAAKVLKRAASLDIDNQEYKTLASEAEDKQRAHSIYSRYK